MKQEGVYNFFDDWLDSQAQKVMEQVIRGQSISVHLIKCRLKQDSVLTN
jgi:hypothetical protein